jgi:hypothetical protein
MGDLNESIDGPTSLFRRLRKGVTESVMRPVPGTVRNTSQNAIKSETNDNSRSNSYLSTTPPPKHYRLEQFDNILSGENIDLIQLRKLSWNGVPPQHRNMVWQLVLGYLPTNKRYLLHFYTYECLRIS